MILLLKSLPLRVVFWKIRAAIAIAITATRSLDEGYLVILVQLRASRSILTKNLDFLLI
jgi:hypothetical protein